MYQRTARDLRDRYVGGEGSAEETVNTFLKRIQQLDGKIGAFLRIMDERVRKKAKALDEKRAAGKPLGKLAGVPIAIKDNIHIKGELSTCGSKFLTNFIAPFDATLVRLLEKEDALLIGKTNLDEFAMGSSTENSALQKTVNPWDAGRVPGGSSGGSAAAVAAGMVPIAFGSDTGGSVRQPASLCGIFGYRPTYGRISRFGLVAFASSFDQIGPFARSADDIALVMEVVGRHCASDATSLPHAAESYLPELPLGIAGWKIGVPRPLLRNLNSEALANFEASLETLKAAGAEIVDVSLDLLKYAIAGYYILTSAEASTNLARFDGIRYGRRSPRAKTLDEIYDFSKNEGFGPEVKRRIFLGTYVLSAGYQEAYYRKAQKARTLMIQELERTFETCDLVALPTSPMTAFKLDEIHDPLQMYLTDIFTAGPSMAGCPAISVPSGFDSQGLPWGLQLVGPQKGDVRVCRAANAFQCATDFHTKWPKLARRDVT